ncbi:gliding motility-associated C-terminal domain-containing protein [Flavobacterium urocaniciphilum]|uniref:Gliding motility-associated C-terminal domain-containing protein n=1 Tax=Flavobacterium urocaniciphilum TaxID=1299341 RepID=A0A1H8ZQ28_9FLAO|nr:gliding motility-associated C-terminal domain-containing protein [Flavobacterium urocaniciphilum]SEP66381.1 gliding motility-associated C-terminal domain-containing protein [Flavobacterium urocaniciphilum]
MKTLKFNIFIFFFSFSLTQSQTVNTGIFNISPQTVVSTVQELNNTASGDFINDGDLYVYSHYNNDGLVSFTSGSTTGITRMKGFNFQNLSGSIPMEWFDAEFNNINIQPAFHLSNQVNIFGQVAFLQGIVNDDNYGGLLVFEDNATHTNVSNVSHVDGYVEKKGNDAFVYPIGDNNLFRYAEISAPDNLNASFTGKYYYENSNIGYPHANRAGVIAFINNTEYWTVEKTEGTSDVFLTLSWNETTTPTEIYAAPYEEIHIVRWDADQQLWVDEGGVANASNKEVTTIVNPLTEYGVFTLARVKTDKILNCAGRGIVIYNAVSPDYDGLNDYFIIDGIQDCPDNEVEIYNRWGVKVFQTNSYDTNGNVFNGFSKGRVTIVPNEKLPSGTYFYILKFKYNEQMTKTSGYLYLNQE